MKTLEIVLNKLKKEFSLAGIDTYSFDAQLIIMKALDISRVKLLTYPDLNIDDDKYSLIMNMAAERLKFKPMQYIMGKCEFMGMEFYVNEHTLIPRGDTEILAEQAIATINNSGYNNALDIGTGSGALAVSIAKYTKAKITATDISKEALAVAEKNAASNNVNVKFIQSNLFENITDIYDVIVSNPPYIETAVIDTLEAQVKDYEPAAALDGGKDGLCFYRKIVQNCHKFLKKDGYLMFEIGYNQGKSVMDIMKNADFYDIQLKKDLAGLDRLVFGRKL